MKAVWNNEVIAESDDTVVIEGNHYFPTSALNKDYLLDSETTSHCPWKGDASYYSLVVNGESNVDAVWYYKDPKPKAAAIANHAAFWKGVEISD